jgi:peroxiredoxin
LLKAFLLALNKNLKTMNKIISLSLLLTVLLACSQSPKNEMAIQNSEKPDTEQQTEFRKLGIKNEVIPKGLNVGDSAPKLMVQTKNGEQVELESLYETQALVVIFYRGFWCPVCNKHLAEFAERSTEIEKAGARILAISPESYENTQQTKNKTGADFLVVSDANGEIMQAFDVQFDVTQEYQEQVENKLFVSIRDANSSNQAVLPIPATFIIDTAGKIVFKQFNPDFRQRASIDEILENLPKANKP